MALKFDVIAIVNNPVPPGAVQDKSKILVATTDTYEEAVEVRNTWNALFREMFAAYVEQPLPRGWAPFAAGTILQPRDVAE